MDETCKILDDKPTVQAIALIMSCMRGAGGATGYCYRY